MFASGGMGAVVWHPLCCRCEWPSSHQRLHVDFQQLHTFAVLKACDTLLIAPAAVTVYAVAATRDAAQAYVSNGSGASWMFAKFRCERSSWKWP